MSDSQNKVILKFVCISLIMILTAAGLNAAVVCEQEASADLLANVERNISFVENDVSPKWQKTLFFNEAGKTEISFRAVFQIDDPGQFAALTLEKPFDFKAITLNGKDVPLPWHAGAERWAAELWFSSGAYNRYADVRCVLALFYRRSAARMA